MADTAKKDNEKKKEDMMQVMQIRPPKLKDKPRNRSRIVLNMKETFGFIPTLLFIDKARGTANKLIISAVLPPEMVEKEKQNESR